MAQPDSSDASSVLEPHQESSRTSESGAASVALDSTQQHYLKKELLNMEIIREFNLLSPTYNDITGLRRFGPPFKSYDPRHPPAQPYDTTQDVEMYEREFPILKFVVNYDIAGFPFIQMHLRRLGAKQGEFWDKLQELFETVKSKRISNSNDRGELSRRQLTLFKLKSLLVLTFNSAIRCTGDEEYFNTASSERNAYKTLAKLTGDSGGVVAEDSKDIDNSDGSFFDLDDNTDFDTTNYIAGLDINVLAVTKMHTSPRTTHYMFLVRVKDEETGGTWFVRKRYSEFAQFHKRARLIYEGNGRGFPSLPSQDKSKATFSGGEEEQGLSEVSSVASQEDAESISTSAQKGQIERNFLHSLRITKRKSITSFHSQISTASESQSFPRESMRVSLRGYLKSLCAVESVRDSAEFAKFIGDNRVVPTAEEMIDLHAREKLDHLVNLQHLKFQRETIRAVRTLEESLAGLKKEVLHSGLQYVFQQLRDRETIESLDPPFKALIQFIELEVAASQYEMLIGSDSARDTFKSLKRIYSLFPFKVLATIMRFTNPLRIAQKVIELFTYQMPHLFHDGRRASLLQALFTGILSDDVKKADKEVAKARESFMARFEEPRYAGILDKIDWYFTTTDETVLQIKKKAEYFQMDLPLSVLLEEQGGSLDDQTLVELTASYMQSKKSKELDEDSLYLMSAFYFKLQLRKYDRLMQIELWEGTEIIDVTKELFTIFFEPLINLFKKAEIYRYVPIFAKYLGELLDLVGKYHKDYSRFNQTDIVASFMNLENKYAQYGYEFLRNFYLNDMATNGNEGSVLNGLVNWFDGFVRLLNFASDRSGELDIDMNKLLYSQISDPRARAKVVERVDEIIAEVNRKRQYYEGKKNENGDVVNGFGDDTQNDNFRKMRNGELTKNWDKINARVQRLAEKMGSEDQQAGGSGGGIYGMLGLKEAEVEEMNMDLLEEEDSEDGSKSGILTYGSPQGFLQEYRKVNQDGSLKSDEEFLSLQEWEDIRYRDDIGQLSGAFREHVFEVLKSFQTQN